MSQNAVTLRASRGLRRWTLLLLAVSAWPCMAAVFHVGPGCAYANLAAAVAAAKSAAGADTIAITGNLAIANTTVVNDANPLTIDGGYASCSATSSSGRSTLDANSMAVPGSILYQNGNGIMSTLTLKHLNIRNSDNTGGTGGAIHAYQPAALTLDTVSVDHNNAQYGAGIYIEGSSSSHAKLTLTNTRIEYNNSEYDGAGLWATHTDISITGDTEITINLAGTAGSGNADGGGIWAGNSNLTVKGHTAPGNQLLGSNTAERNGGGLFLKETLGGPYNITLQNDRADQPLVVQNNTAGDFGGAFYLETSSNTEEIITSVTMYNVIVDTNFATDGRGAAFEIVARDNGGSFPIITNVNLYQSGAGDSIPRCATGLECNAIINNEATSAANYGSAVAVELDHAAHALAGFHIEHGYFRGNLVNDAVVSGNGYVTIDSSLIAQNTSSHFLVETYDDNLEISNATIAGNTLPAAQASVYALRVGLTFYHNLVDQPGATVCTVSTPTYTDVIDLGVSVGTLQDACTGTNVQSGFPSFVDPVNGDFHLLFSSQAIDRWTPATSSNSLVPDVDLDGYPRPHFGLASLPYDFGAYEYGSEKIFANGFEGL